MTKFYDNRATISTHGLKYALFRRLAKWVNEIRSAYTAVFLNLSNPNRTARESIEDIKALMDLNNRFHDQVAHLRAFNTVNPNWTKRKPSETNETMLKIAPAFHLTPEEATRINNAVTAQLSAIRNNRLQEPKKFLTRSAEIFAHKQRAEPGPPEATVAGYAG
jgi:hypothetical protein